MISKECKRLSNVHEKHVGYDLTSFDKNADELRRIAVKDFAAPTDMIRGAEHG